MWQGLFLPSTWLRISIVLQGEYPGLLGLVTAYVDSLDVEEKVKLRLSKYLDLIRRRADGEKSRKP